MFILKEWKNEIEKSYILKKDFDGLQWKTYALNEFRPFNFQTQAQAGPTRCQMRQSHACAPTCVCIHHRLVCRRVCASITDLYADACSGREWDENQRLLSSSMGIEVEKGNFQMDEEGSWQFSQSLNGSRSLVRQWFRLS